MSDEAFHGVGKPLTVRRCNLERVEKERVGAIGSSELFPIGGCGIGRNQTGRDVPGTGEERGQIFGRVMVIEQTSPPGCEERGAQGGRTGGGGHRMPFPESCAGCRGLTPSL